MYKLTESIKYKGQYLKRGQTVQLSSKEYEYLDSKGFVADYRGDSPSVNEVVKEKFIEQPEANREADFIDYENLTKAELKILLDNEGIDYTAQETKKELIEKLAR